MSDEEEVSASGAPIFRHGERTKPFELATGDPDAIQKLEAHLARFLGEPRMVWHEIVSDLVHVDVHEYPPRKDRPFTTLVTTGMSDRPMRVPDEAPAPRYAELLICLPEGWPMDREAFEDERNYWPIRALKAMARFPHAYDTWLGWGHTIPNGDPPQPLAPGVPFSSVLVELPVTLPQEFHTVELSAEKKVAFFSLVPLHDDELRLKLTKGLEALEELFDAKGVNEVVDVKRPSVARRRWLGVF